MEPRCPECQSPDIDPPTGGRPEWRCRACGAFFPLEDTLVSFAEAEAFGRPSQDEPAFTLDREAAERELRDPDGVIGALSPYADPEELRGTLLAAVEGGIIEVGRPGAGLRVHVSTGAEPHPVLVVDPGAGVELAGPELALRPEPGEDPVAYTLRWLGRIVADARAAVAGRRVPLPGGVSADERSGLPGRRYQAICSALFADGTVGATLAEADALSLTGVLAEIGERLEAAGLGPQVDALDLTVSWQEGD
ncbi:MAG: hypothetical protein JST59_30245 [Actinobacteria bacterium]|nr:hypothetical protein [Actinomycetota bacterium]